MQIEVGYCDHPDSAIAGRNAAKNALERAGRADPCDLLLLFCTARHDRETVRQEVARATGNTSAIFGGGATGIITNDRFGYGGDQVGVACVWLDGSSFHSICEDGLDGDERETGSRIGRVLSGKGISPEDQLLLFFDSTKRSPSGGTLVSATRILEGMEEQLGFLPDIMGAGLQGDQIFTPTEQFLGDRVDRYHAMVLGFSCDIAIDSVIVHGCRPSSDYFKVTKADGSAILEIDGVPALDFMDGLLGSDLAPEEYPFFLTLGINHGKANDEYDEKKYASRLCQGIDKEKRAIIMFEPDMVEGTSFQIMHRRIELDYILPAIQGLLDSLEDREPFFALYINCAGRAAGLGGAELEDALVVQDIAKDRFPLFGIYTGVEIAALGGRPRSLDWTGVFCVFSKSKGSIACPKIPIKTAWKINEEESGEKRLSFKNLQNLCVQNTAKILGLGSQNIAIRNELEQKRRGFKILADFSSSFRDMKNRGDIFSTATQRINASLNMQKTALLLPYQADKFIPAILQGYSQEDEKTLLGLPIAVGPEFSDPAVPLLITGKDDENYLAGIRNILKLPYLISVPIMLEKDLYGILITGREVESPPFLNRLNKNDVETVQAIASFLATTLLYKKLGEVSQLAATDPLTGLFNRKSLEHSMDEIINCDDCNSTIVFVLIDLDEFKTINDNYGHLAGDHTLKSMALLLKKTFRSSDIISRFGGDEFAVACVADENIDNLLSRIADLVHEWRETSLSPEGLPTFSSTISVGVAIAEANKTSFKELVHGADKALYETKEKGRDSLTVYYL